MKESEIQRAILDWLALSGYSAWKMPLGAMQVKGGYFAKNPLKGFPDIFGICKYQPGRLFTIEVKTPVGKLAPMQKEWMTKLCNLGCLSIVATNVDTVRDYLKVNDSPKF